LSCKKDSILIFNTLNTGASSNLIVTLDGNAKLAHSIREGHYILTSIPVNGKQCWIQEQGSNAIWYDKKFRNWKIGGKKHNGTSTSSLYSTNDALRPEEATTWEYWNDDGGWLTTSNMFVSLSM
jgi:hypothetical protein